MILAADIGGTNSRLGLFDDALALLRESTATNAEHASFGDIATKFLAADRGKIDRACFGVAGPIAAGRVKLTNLNWELAEDDLSQRLGIARVALVNDLLAHAEGVELLKPDQLIVLSAGQAQPKGNRAVIAAGTGLGEAGIVWDEHIDGYRAVACEGGHCDFAAKSEREFRLFEYLRSRQIPTEWEAVLSGPGVRRIYDFLCTDSELGAHAGLLGKDPTPAQIARAAIDGSNSACVAALESFIAFYGAEAGNLALKYLATGGIYIGGGIAPQIVDKLRSSTFINRFEDKGLPSIRALLKKIPIFIINSPANALYGAANFARRMKGTE